MTSPMTSLARDDEDTSQGVEVSPDNDQGILTQPVVNISGTGKIICDPMVLTASQSLEAHNDASWDVELSQQEKAQQDSPQDVERSNDNVIPPHLSEDAPQGVDSLDKDLLFPPRPQEPLASDCCGTGCTPCVFDLYDQEVVLWQTECERLKHGHLNNDDDSQVVLSCDQYRKFQLLSISSETCDSNKYTFVLPGYRALPLSVGQHLVLRWQTPDKVLTKQYTPITSGETKGKMEFIIKLYPDGEMSRYINSWTVGDNIDWRGPFGNFTYKRNSFRHMLMLAAGTGIAPMVQFIRHVLSDDEDDTRLHLVYACRNYSTILCKDLLDEWKDYWNYTSVYVLSQEDSNSQVAFRYGDEIIRGRLTQELVHDYVLDLLPDVRVLVCGTKSFDKDIINYLRTTDLPNNSVFKF